MDQIADFVGVQVFPGFNQAKHFCDHLLSRFYLFVVSDDLQFAITEKYADNQLFFQGADVLIVQTK